MRRILGAIAVASVLSLIVAGTAAAHGLNPHRLFLAGWECFNVEGLGVHCAEPGHHARTANIVFLVFDTDDPHSTDAPFAGTELLIRADLYHGQPCATDGGGTYHELDLTGDGVTDYFACHHYDTSG
ncbi:MAG: hypothetical protein FIA92_14485 [Chloroflexi bacterium]|nr:hypothetical protein [Chloroflexota bacterium]